MNAKEQIKKLQKQLDSLKAELDKPEFDVGDWVVSNLGEIGRIKNDGLELCPNTSNTAYCLGDMSDIKRLATRTEIETALRKEAERRGFKKGVKYKGASCNWTEYIHGSLEYFKDGDVLTDGYGESVYKQGKWASIVEDKVKFFDWDVEQKDISTYGQPNLSIYNIGCESYKSDFLKDLKGALEYMPNKTVAEVLTELEKLDLD